MTVRELSRAYRLGTNAQKLDPLNNSIDMKLLGDLLAVSWNKPEIKKKRNQEKHEYFKRPDTLEEVQEVLVTDPNPPWGTRRFRLGT